MKFKDALTELSFHSGRNEDIANPKWENGFLGSLRPYKNMTLVEDSFHKVVYCLRSLLPYIKENDHLDKCLVSDISGIICFGRAWGVDDGGMLRSNSLISKSEASKLEELVDCISYIWTTLLDTEDESIAFEIYDANYKK